MDTQVKRCWDIEGWMRGEVFEAGGFLLQREHPLMGSPDGVYVVGRRVGGAGVRIDRIGDGVPRIWGEFFTGAVPPDDIRWAIKMSAAMRRGIELVARVSEIGEMPIVGRMPVIRELAAMSRYASGVSVHSFIDFTPIANGEETDVRRLVSDALQMDPSCVLGFDK